MKITKQKLKELIKEQLEEQISDRERIESNIPLLRKKFEEMIDSKKAFFTTVWNMGNRNSNFLKTLTKAQRKSFFASLIFKSKIEIGDNNMNLAFNVFNSGIEGIPYKSIF